MDAMCGSGTILTEAALLAYNIPPQLGRDYFCFKRWTDFEPDLWESVIRQAKERETPFAHQLIGKDLAFQAIRVTERNVEAAGLEGKIELKRKDFFKLEPIPGPGFLIMNPPYNERMEIGDAVQFYKAMGDTFKKCFKGWQVWIISSNLEALKHLGLQTSAKIPLFNGALECKFVKYDIY